MWPMSFRAKLCRCLGVGVWGLALLLALGTVAPSLAQQRVALVVGNSDYRSVGRLANPGNDAKLVARTLKASGFTLIGGDAQLDLDKPRFDAAVEQFGRAIAGAEAVLFYYSGHGLQVNGTNYLVPVDANPTRAQDLDFQMVSADLVLRQMSGSGTKLNIIVLDACRNNPFDEAGLRGMGGGLAEMKAPEGTLISYATQPGAVARDGAGQDSPFTLALVDAIRQPGLDIFRLFNRVGLEVKKTTNGQQQPWLSASPIEGEFSFVAAPPPVVPAPAPAPVAAAPATDATADTDQTRKTSAGPAGGKPTAGRPTAPEAAPAPPTKLAALMPPLAPPALLPQVPSSLPERPGTGFQCPTKDWYVFGEDQVFDWSGSAVTVRSTTSSWSWRSLGSDPAAPNVCLRTGRNGVLHRLVGWFDTDQNDFSDNPEQPFLALLQGQSSEASVHYSNRRAAGSGVSFETHWTLHGHERFVIGGRGYDTLVFDLNEASNRNSSTGTGRVWYAPALGMFVRKIWRRSTFGEVVGFSVLDVSANGGGNGDSRGESAQ